MSRTHEITDFWDTQADRYDRAFDEPGRAGQALRSRQEAVLSLLGEGPGEVLDAGMGPGRLLIELSERGWQVSGVDASDQMVALAGRRLPEARKRLALGSVERLPFPDSSFDAVVATGVLEYVAYSDRAIAELARVLRPGGLAVLSVPDLRLVPKLWRRGLVYPLARALKRIVPFGRPPPPWRPPPPDRHRFEEALAEAGLATQGRAPIRRATQLVYAARKASSVDHPRTSQRDTPAPAPGPSRAPVLERCPICGTGSCLRLYRWGQGLQVWRCPGCGLLYTDPLPGEEELANYYRALSRTEAEPGHMRRRDDLEGRLATVQDAVGQYLQVTAEITGADRVEQMLDAGGGLGLYSRAAENLGVQAHYVEIDEESVAFAREKLGLERVKEADVTALRNHVDGPFDLVLCRHVIEHARDPDSLVEQLASVVRPGGVIVFETPNADNREQWAHPGVLLLYWKTLGRENPELSRARRLALTLAKPLSAATPPKHLYGLNSENLATLLQRHHLEPRRRFVTVCGDPIFDPLYDWGDRSERGGVTRTLYRAYERTASALVRIAGRGSRLVVFAQRVEPE